MEPVASNMVMCLVLVQVIAQKGLLQLALKYLIQKGSTRLRHGRSKRQWRAAYPATIGQFLKVVGCFNLPVRLLSWMDQLQNLKSIHPRKSIASWIS